MSPIADQLTIILTSVLEVLRALALWSPPPPRVVSLGRDTWIVPGARGMADNPHLPPIPVELRALLRDRAARAVSRLLALFARWQAGTLPRPRYDYPRPRPQVPATRRPPRPYQRLPRSKAWAGLRSGELRICASQLTFLLARPDMAPFLAACPQAGRLLRPLCDAIGTELPQALVLPARPRHPRPPRPPRQRPLALSDPRLKLQPYVIRAVRHARRKYGCDG